MLEEEVVAGVSELAFMELLRQRLQKNVPVAAPAAGADWSISVPAGEAWELLAVRFVFVTSAVVVNRHGPVIVDDGATEYYRAAWNAAQTASLVGTFTIATGHGTAFGASGFNELPLPTPPLVVPERHRIRVATVNIDAGDQYSAIVLTVRQWSIRDALLNIEWIKNHAR